MCLHPRFIKKIGKYVACHHCVECNMQESDIWSFRCVFEAMSHEKNMMITLTYDPEHLPEGSTIVKRDVQLFIKRLRKKIEPVKIRFFAVGEYGSLRGHRPHYHILIFGYEFPDLFFFKMDKKKQAVFRSPTLEKLWTFGYSAVSEVNQETAKYVSKYMQKIPKDGRLKPFKLMSLRPAIGRNYVLAHSDWSITHKMYLNGRTKDLPKYYEKVLGNDKFLEARAECFLEGPINEPDLEKISYRLEKFSKKYGKTVDFQKDF